MVIPRIVEDTGGEPAATDLSTIRDRTAERLHPGELRLLIIDDEIPQNDALIQLLRSEGVEASCAQSGTLGLTYARSGAFDAILLDLKLPDVLGMTVLSLIRAERLPPPVIVLTGHFLDTDHEEKALHLGAAAFLRKPIFNIAELAVMLRRIVRCHVPPDRDAAPCAAVVAARTPRRLSPSRREILGLTDLHARALEADAAAIEEIIRLLLPELRARLRRRFPSNAEDWIDRAIEDALLEYRARPGRYAPKRGLSLDAYLEYNASRNVLNAIDSARRRLAHETTAIASDFWHALPGPSPDKPSERLQLLRSILVRVRASLTADERIVYDLQMSDEHDAEVIARALRLGHLPRREQVRRVRLLTNAVRHTVRRALLRFRDRRVTGSNS